MAQTVPTSINHLDVRETSGTFLIRTRSNGLYTLECFADSESKVLVSGGSKDRPTAFVTLEGSEIRLSWPMVFTPEAGHTTMVIAIYDITGKALHEVAQLGKEVL